MPKVNKTKYAILGVLDMRPCSGYDIKKFCDSGISHFWNENFGHIYPVLKELEKEGSITKAVEQGDGKPSRNVYSITQKGKEELTQWLLQPVEHSPARLELLLKLYFAKSIPAASMIEELERVKEKHAQRLETLLKMEKLFLGNETAKSDAGFPFWLSTLRYGIYDAEFRIKWCEETITNISAHQLGK
ncbi:MAG: PadR family transcriptional regulator [Clostridia bacterium]|nr:PadR family transcriptional regulator [Clostridia bacterium]